MGDSQANTDDNNVDLFIMKKLAEFRGGKLLSEEMRNGDFRTKLRFLCGSCNMKFEMSPALIILGGHWCPYCYIPIKRWDYDKIAPENPFFFAGLVY